MALTSYSTLTDHALDRGAFGTSIMCLDQRGHVLSSTSRTMNLFPVGKLEGRSVDSVLSDAELFGIVAPDTANRVATMLNTRSRSLLCDMRDGRTILLNAIYGFDGNIDLEFTDVTEALFLALSHQRDVLTGLPNRLALLTRLSESISRSLAQEAHAALLYIDLDRFKSVNDTLGHPVGDSLLKLVTERMTKLLKPDDLLVRLGGDEFAIFQVEGQQPVAAQALAERIIELIGRTYLIQGHSVQVGASVGIALVATDGETPDELIKNADLALFKAKADGRGIFRFFTEEMDRKIQLRRKLEIDLRRALALREFSLVYQPQYQIRGTKLVGFEALLRWNSEERGSVSPADFIPLAEEIGLIVPLGEWVMRTACLEAASWTGELSISVNLSPLQFRTPNLVSVVISALSNAGLASSRLELEITEGALMDDTDAVVATLRQIKALGVKISMDDFGTGYSSLSYLQKFPFDKIKIDQSFVRNLENNPDSAAIVRAVTALGESLGMVTIAEGVETEYQLEQITKDGCQQVQGYLTGRPVSAESASNLASSYPTGNQE